MAIEEVYLHPDDYNLEVGSRSIDDLAFWLDMLGRERPRTVLEVGCGTGRLTLPLAREGAARGFRVTGLDLECSMLEHARARLAEEPLPVQAALHLIQADVRTLSLEERFDVVLLPYGVAHHLLDLDEQITAWRAVRQHLRPGGLLGVDLGAPDLRFLSSALQETSRRVDLDVSEGPERHLRRSVVSRYAPASQCMTHFYEYIGRQPSTLAYHYPSVFAMHVYFPREVQLLCRLTGYRVERMIGSYTGEEFDDDSNLLIVLARAA
jgi:SAM-dependent methyltransferase